jgi:hypothetical protein
MHDRCIIVHELRSANSWTAKKMSESTKSQESESGIGSGSGSCKDEPEKTSSNVEPDIVDTTNDPRCWPNASKLRATSCIGLLSFLEPFASSMVAPSLEIIAEEFNITSPVERNVSDNMLLQTVFENVRQLMLSPTAPTFCLYLTVCHRSVDSGTDLRVGRPSAGSAVVCVYVSGFYGGWWCCTE